MRFQGLLFPLLLVACTRPPQQAAAGEQAPAADAAPAPATPAAAPAITAAPQPTGTATSCDGARFALDASTVVATVDGKAITAGELGPELARAEAAALRTYCDAVAQVRTQALDHNIRTRLLAQAAGSEDPQTWLRNKLGTMVADPSDQDIESFYAQRKSDTAPPLEQVRDQVIAAIKDERMQDAAQQVFDELRGKATIVQSMPDVRPPPVDLSDAPTTATAGAKDAAVQVVEFSDFECPYCVRAATELTKIKAEFGDKIHVSYRHFPLSFHPNAREAAEAAQCAVAQDKFWAFHDAVFAASGNHALADGGIRKAAEEAKLDMGALDACLAAGEAKAQVEADIQKGTEVGVEGTPSFFVNGRALAGGAGELRSAIEAELSKSS